MKKIFAIALALVMVLSMASAFAFVGTCGDYAYTCPTAGCGVAKAEVVQFAADNSADGFEETTCAGVVKDQPIFYGVKVIFDKDVNAQWYAHKNTGLQVTVSNATPHDNAFSDITFYGFEGLTDKKAHEASTKVFWLKGVENDGVWTYSLTTAFDPATCVFEATATNTRAEVCANVVYNFNGVGANLKDIKSKQMDDGWIKYGSFEVKVEKDASGAEFKITVKKGADEMVVYVLGGVVKYVAFDDGIYYKSEGDLLFAKDATVDEEGKLVPGAAGVVKANLTCSTLETMLALIKLDFGYCVNADVVKNIFGWVNGDPVCATWNKDAKAIVNAECEVQVMQIPKTGDKSVLAWLF